MRRDNLFIFPLLYLARVDFSRIFWIFGGIFPPNVGEAFLANSSLIFPRYFVYFSILFPFFIQKAPTLIRIPSTLQKTAPGSCVLFHMLLLPTCWPAWEVNWTLFPRHRASERNLRVKTKTSCPILISVCPSYPGKYPKNVFLAPNPETMACFSTGALPVIVSRLYWILKLSELTEYNL